MAKAHEDAKSTISLALVAALVVRPLDPSLSRDELERVVTVSGVSNQVYKEVIQEELAKRDQERARRVTISGFDLMRFQVTEGFPPQIPIDTAYDLGQVFERLNYEGVRVPKTLDALRAACDAPGDQVDRALGFMLVFGIAKKVDGGFVCEGMQGDYGKVAVIHPDEAKLARMVDVVRAITTTEPVRTESKATTVDSKADSADAQAVTSGDATKVFIIHGRNTAARNAVEQFVRSLGRKTSPEPVVTS